MKTLQRLLLLTLAPLLLANQCKKEDFTKLPPESQDGSGWFGCTVNEEPILQYTRIKDHIWPEGDYNINEELFTLVFRTKPTEYHVNFFVTRPRLGTGTFVIDSVIFYPSDSSMRYYYMAKNTPQIKFTRFDEIFSPAIASGTFEFDADTYEKETHQYVPNQKIEVRAGRFDVRYYPH